MQTLRTVWFPPALIVLALILLGAQRPALRWIVVVTAMLVCMVPAVASLRRRGLQTAGEWLHGTHPLLVVALPALAALQVGLQATLGSSNGPLADMIAEASRFTALALFYLLVRCAAADRRATAVLIGALAVIGAVEASYGLLNLLAGNEKLLFFKRQAYFHSATGTLVNRNHFAYLIELLLPATLAYLYLDPRAIAGRTDRTPASEQTARSVLLATMCVVEALALLFSRSRMGIVCFLVACSTMLALSRAVAPAHQLQGHAPRKGRATGILLVAGAITVALAIGIDPVLERFAHLGRDVGEGNRLDIWRATIAMAADHPILGHGLGTFEALLPGYRPMPTGLFYDHAHNDYLEILAEGGVVGVAVVAAIIIAFVRRLLGVLAQPLTTTQRQVLFWLGTAIVSVLLHSTADFGLRITAVAFTFVYVAALFSRVSENPELIDGRRVGPRKEPPPR